VLEKLSLDTPIQVRPETRSAPELDFGDSTLIVAKDSDFAAVYN